MANGVEGTREADEEDIKYVLRFAAFHHATYLKYKPPIAHSSIDMRRFQNADERKREELRSAFKIAVTLVRSLLGQMRFVASTAATRTVPMVGGNRNNLTRPCTTSLCGHSLKKTRIR